MKRILLIEDEAPVRQVMRHMLESGGYAVIEAEHGAAGLQELRTQTVDLVITDLFMPEKEGIETIRELRKTYPTVKILAVSGGGRSGRMVFLANALHLGAHRTLAKPFSRQELLDTVAALLQTE
ncbi:MAG: response regulator [Candidatus Binatia bacterium]|nr:response regulator [Candidatus Binatia bacterium]